MNNAALIFFKTPIISLWFIVLLYKAAFKIYHIILNGNHLKHYHTNSLIASDYI